jgi:hypothetical protein
MRQVPRIAAGTEQARLGAWADAKFRRRTATHNDQAGAFAARRITTVVIGDEISVEAAAEPRRLASLKGREVLDQIWNAREWPVRQPLADRGAGLLILPVHDRVDLGIDGLRPSNRQVEQFTGADFALADQAGERDRVILAIFFKSHDFLFHSRFNRRAPGRPLGLSCTKLAIS